VQASAALPDQPGSHKGEKQGGSEATTRRFERADHAERRSKQCGYPGVRAIRRRDGNGYGESTDHRQFLTPVRAVSS
jgi:hypothetical protein